MMRKSFELLHQYMGSQKNDSKIDGFALIYAIRIIAEKIVYERLTDKNKFNNCRTTIERIELLEDEKLKEELQLFHSFYNKYFHVDAYELNFLYRDLSFKFSMKLTKKLVKKVFESYLQFV